MGRRALVLPFLAGALLVAAGVAAYYWGRSDTGRSETVENVGLALVWAGAGVFALGVVLVAVYGLTRFIAWAARR